MPVLDQFGRPFASSRPLAPTQRNLRARPDASRTTAENSRHWANADGLSANAAASASVRRILRNRARYEACESNSYAKGIVLTLANDTIGTGPRLQLLTDNREANSRIEKLFGDWVIAVGLADKLRTLRLAKVVDGEGFALMRTNPKIRSPIKLDLQIIEADQVSTPDLSVLDENAIDGIRFDSDGNPIEYHVLKQHPGSDSPGMTGNYQDYDRVLADAMLHLFRVDRAGQQRGWPEITPALPLFAQLRRYMLAVVAAAETAADFAGVMYTDSPAIEQPADVDEMDAVELEMRAMLTLPAGWKMGQVKAEQPPTTFDMFVASILREIARCLNMPYNVAAGDSSGYNYASGRLDHQTYYKSIKIEQHYFETHALDLVLAQWFDEAVLLPGFLPEGLGPISDWLHQWFWDGTEHVDPLKEANAQKVRLANHVTTLAREFARQGLDWESELRQAAVEKNLMDELGLVADESDVEVEEKEEEAEKANA